MTEQHYFDAGAQPQGVANPQRITFYLGNPPRQMLIFSGVVIPEWDSEKLLDWMEAVVKLGATTTEYFQYTSTVGLAGIYNEDSDFDFYANTSWVLPSATTGELELHVPLGVRGDPKSVLERFSYHVQVLSDPVTSLVAGTIRWADIYGDPSQEVLDGATAMFHVEAGVTTDEVEHGIITPTWEKRDEGFSTVVPINAAGIWAVPYVIENLPLGMTLEVRPDPPGPSLRNLPGGYNPNPLFVPETRKVDLTLAAPAAIGVDFDMVLSESPA